MNSSRLGSFRIDYSQTQHNSVDTYPGWHGTAKRSYPSPFVKEECLAWGNIDTTLAASKECHQEDGTILIGANQKRGRSIDEPDSDVRDVTLDHGNDYVHLIYVNTWQTDNVKSILSCCNVGQEGSGIIMGEAFFGEKVCLKHNGRSIGD